MGRKLFVLLVILMSVSLIGIILVQAYFIKNSLQNEENRFELNVKHALSWVSKSLEDKEFDRYARKVYELEKRGVNRDTSAIREILIKTQDDQRDETIIYRNTILEESFKVPSVFFDIGVDSISISRLFNERETKIYSNTALNNEGDLNINPERTYREYLELPEVEKKLFETTYRDYYKNFPIYKRVSPEEVSDLLQYQLKEDGIDIDFEFAIYDKDLATKVQSENFELNNSSTYGVSVFLDNNKQSDYRLYVDFPERRKFLFSTIIKAIVLSVVFTLIIIIAYSNAIYQLIKQRKISQIKTDFINNMTHEFKTPIATINLALDAIKNPKIIEDQDKVKRYLKMIKDENKRMHAQVENVLRISKLEKNELNISKDRVKLHDLIEDAITHVELIVEDRKGYVKTHLNASKSSILANESHFTNVIVNILDNAIKYSDDEPKIDVYTENIGNNILLKIADQGNGMSKQVQRKIFEKFYREHSGNVHNVKGHGLGLAYVKRIVEDHHGHISVESEKGKGSVFTIKLPLIS
ncbi:sensor histidine kinase KdpD [Mangrovimonas sp. YM274]|uniref:sensor histidine kinase n=1 Tax=Mangrovimonas sp. YM274 TaxID=3070660 RepID=UPI0027DBF5BB|nr:HAMP domain-containing sensor histidine kinase [Mangrovimonas sp. YM274]WMI67597.1 HAMP domain-containing sensor histidine kinase [Mangrovimonas sp. YM274]